MQTLYQTLIEQASTQSMELKLYTLSPVHVGTGETMAPMDYVLHNRTFYRINQAELFALVRQLPDGARQLANWIGERFDEMRDLRDNREQSELNAQTNVLSFFQEMRQESLIINYLRSKGGLPVRLDDDNRQRTTERQRLGDVREAIRTGGKVYLPGSSLKGALRTALLYDYLQRCADFKDLKQLISQRLEDRRVKKETFAQPLEGEAFFCAMVEKGRIRPVEAQMDLLRFVGLTDAMPANAEVALEVGKINLYLVEKERSRDQRGRGGAKLMASRQKQSSYAEMIAPGQILHTTLSCNATGLAFLLQKYLQQPEGIASREGIYYLDLRQKVQRLFALPDALLDQPEPQALAEAILAHCLQAITSFARAQRNRQAEWLADYAAQNDPEKYGERIARGYTTVNHHAGRLLHLGYAAGFDATTVLLFFLENQGYHALYERVMEVFELGRAPKQPGQYTPNIKRFPKSRRLVEDQNAISPLGWMAVLTADELPAPGPTVADPHSSSASASPLPVQAEAPTPQYYTGRINPNRPPELDAVVVHSGTPNRVKVYLSPENSREVTLQAYRSPLPVGAVIRVLVQVNKKGEVLGASYRGVK